MSTSLAPCSEKLHSKAHYLGVANYRSCAALRTSKRGELTEVFQIINGVPSSGRIFFSLVYCLSQDENASGIEQPVERPCIIGLRRNKRFGGKVRNGFGDLRSQSRP
jgi:hypothetical protein